MEAATIPGVLGLAWGTRRVRPDGSIDRIKTKRNKNGGIKLKGMRTVSSIEIQTVIEREIEDKEKTITCSKLINGDVAYGILNELSDTKEGLLFIR